MTRGVKKDPKPTWTSAVQRAMREADDFVNAHQLRERTGGNADQVSAALSHLRKFEVVDSVESGGVLWWFLTGHDRRQQVVEERTPEVEPRKRKPGYKSPRRKKPGPKPKEEPLLPGRGGKS